LSETCGGFAEVQQPSQSCGSDQTAGHDRQLTTRWAQDGCEGAHESIRCFMQMSLDVDA